MKRLLPLLAILVLAGCAGTETKIPPSFNRGDLVKVKDNAQVGIVVGVEDHRGHWTYTIMFKDVTIKYGTSELTLVERFNWNRHYKAEISPTEMP